MSTIEKDKVAILDRVKAINENSNIRVTLSIAISNEGNDNLEKYKSALAAMEIVLGRGGDRDALFADYNVRISSQIDYDKLWADDGSRAALSSDPNGDIYLRHPKGETVEDYQSEISVSHWNFESHADRDPSDPKNSPLRVDASINPLKGLLKNE